jgi:DNA-binding NarL/FixJ family response regulator
VEHVAAVTDPGITVFLADDNLLVREGVRALLATEPDLEVVGTAADYDELIDGAEAAAPQVIVTDIRMPPAFQREGIDAAKQVRKRHPGTGVVVLSQYDDLEYAISLLREGSQGYAYLLKDRVDQGEQLAKAVRAVAVGGSMLDPAIAEALVTPVSDGPPRRRPRPPSRASSSSWPSRPRLGPTAPCAGCACSTRPSWSARSGPRRSAACCRRRWSRSCAARAAASATASGWS